MEGNTEENNNTNKVEGEENLRQGAAAPAGLNLGGGAQLGGGADYGRVAELERELQANRVENGRAKALAQRVRELEEENRRLAAERDEALARGKDYMSEIPESLRDQVDPVAAKAFGQMLDARDRRRDEREMAERRRREADDARTRKARLLEEIDRRFPGFLRDTQPGGDKCAAWERFLGGENGWLVRAAHDAGDVGGLSTLINVFLSEAGIQTRGAAQAGAPRPATADMKDIADPNGPGRIYTQAEYSSLLEDAGAKVRSGRISRQDYMKVREELSRAMDEGRVRL